MNAALFGACKYALSQLTAGKAPRKKDVIPNAMIIPIQTPHPIYYKRWKSCVIGRWRWLVIDNSNVKWSFLPVSERVHFELRRHVTHFPSVYSNLKACMDWYISVYTRTRVHVYNPMLCRCTPQRIPAQASNVFAKPIAHSLIIIITIAHTWIKKNPHECFR